MKEHTELLSRNVFALFPNYHVKTERKYSPVNIFKKYASTLREQLVNVLAATGIGAILLVSIAFFLIQLAEYGGR